MVTSPTVSWRLHDATLFVVELREVSLRCYFSNFVGELCRTAKHWRNRDRWNKFDSLSVFNVPGVLTGSIRWNARFLSSRARAVTEVDPTQMLVHDFYILRIHQRPGDNVKGAVYSRQ